ncbi:MAG TPA: hypothetical protein VLM75_12905 [Spirochaetota bacterium]|nr:hypothetical protein [Spirochaetota bacterium]
MNRERLESKDIVLFSEEELGIITAVTESLASRGMSAEIEAVSNNRMALEQLGRSISFYPSILAAHRLGAASRSVESLVETLCRDDIPDMILHIPTKAVLGRSYSIAKINFLNMLRYIVRDVADLSPFEEKVLHLIAHNVFTIMAEEVYISIIENAASPERLRSKAAHLLARTWEYRLDSGVREFEPILRGAWRAREKLIPNFGTMLGFSELFVISGYIEPAWFDFLQSDETGEDEVHALEEFIFGMNHEEILALRGEMDERGMGSVTREEAMARKGPKSPLHRYKGDDPRQLYRSFRDRKINARFRSRARLEGPKRTLEDYLMCFLLSPPGDASGASIGHE